MHGPQPVAYPLAVSPAAKAALHRLVDELPEAELHAARRFLEFAVSAGLADGEDLEPEAEDRLTLDRLRRMEERGEYVTNKDVVAWMRSWGTKNELPRPKPTKRQRR